MTSTQSPLLGNTVRTMKDAQVAKQKIGLWESKSGNDAPTVPVPIIKKKKQQIAQAYQLFAADDRKCALSGCGADVRFGRCIKCGDDGQATNEEKAVWRASGLSDMELKKSPSRAVQALNTMTNYEKAHSPDRQIAKTSPLYKDRNFVQTPTPKKSWEKKRTVMESPLPARHQIPKLKALMNSEDPEKIFAQQVKIGSGADGEVFSAMDIRETNLKKAKVAIKKIELTEDNWDDLATEIDLMRRCKHANVVGFRDAFMVGQRVWIVMEFVRAGALTDLVLKAPDEIMAYITREILLALEFMHKNHRLHRDIKSDNVLMSSRGYIKLADFGFATQLSEDRNKRSTMCGTPYWMAPELIESKPYGPGVDIWSMAILLRELMEREPPYYRETPTKALLRIMQEGIPPLTDVSKWSVEIRDFLDKALQMNPDARWTASQLLDHPFIQKACDRKDGPKQLIAKVMEIKSKEKSKKK